MKLKDAAAALGISAHYMRKEARAGRMPHFKSGNRYYFDTDLVSTYLNNIAIRGLNENRYSERGRGLRKVQE